MKRLRALERFMNVHLTTDIMQRIVLDTNCLIMAISTLNRYNTVWQSFIEGRYTLCITNEIIEEYHEVMARNINQRVADAVIFAILNRNNVERLTPHYHFHLIKADEDDNKFVDCAIAANAKFIVSEDHHFSVLRQIPFPKVSVIGIDEFVKHLEQI